MTRKAKIANHVTGEIVTLSPESIVLLVETLAPMIREALRAEIQAIRPLDEAWYEPAEVEAMSCGKVRARTLRDWLRWGQIDGESDGQQVRLYQSTVEELRKNKWRPLREPDPSKLPPSKRHTRFFDEPAAK
ncbi:MAG: hypothetical protein LLF97_06690 [Planctomycetaceae bacterium]|nr:hypothetical protein [Planctomycetaceae bacterium]